MDEITSSHSGSSGEATKLLDELRSHPEWDEPTRMEQLDLLVGRFPREILISAILPRLNHLGAGDGEAILRIVEGMGDSSTLSALADALLEQPNLSSERTWDALGVLEGSGLIEANAELSERREDLEELLNDHESLGELAAEIESDPASTWLALQGLCEIEPDVRSEIIQGLAESDAGPGVVALIRLFAFAHDPTTRKAAIQALSGSIGETSDGRMAWAALAHDHPDPNIQNLAYKTLRNEAKTWIASWLASDSPRARPSLIRSAVSGVDREGRGVVVLESEDRGDRVAAGFHCDVVEGIVDVVGEIDTPHNLDESFLDQLLAAPGRVWVQDRHGLALGLLAGSALLCGPKTHPALTYWLERTAGPDFRPSIVRRPGLKIDRGTFPAAERAEWSRLVLQAMPDWWDDSALTHQIADSIRLRDGDTPPDPRRDPGAFRILFENRLEGRLDLYRRQLLWMSFLWAETEQTELARAAEAVAGELSDPQNAVPGHPFLELLAIRSLAAAQAR